MPKQHFPTAQELLRNLSEAFGPSGHEDDVRAYIIEQIKPLVDEFHVDAIGNLIAVKQGSSPRKLMLDAHTDEIGVMVRYIDEHGFLRFAKIGGWDDRIFPAHRVKLKGRDGGFYHGVIGMAPPHVLSDDSKQKTIKAEDYFIDIGATSAAEAAALGARVGDPGVIEYPYFEFAPNHVMGKAFDDRAGCALLILLLQALAEGRVQTTLTLYASFATSEEVGLRGARVAAYTIDPELAIALEGTIGSDFPGVPAEKRPCAARNGPVISVIDNSIIVPRKMSDFQMACAERAKVPYQVKMPIYGGTNAGSIHLSRAGVLTGVLAVPCRYIHSPNTTLYWPDFEHSLALLEEMVRSAHTLLE
ncbi:M42 family peptidase [candidate division KSB1 bacterium]|nr:M42 family peptidase [candidate division KSB1 bacterium]